MGCDIHWILERKHLSGTWHAVLSKRESYHLFKSFNIEGMYEHPMYEIGDRNYDRFTALSGVRGFTNVPWMNMEIPENASDYTRGEEEGWGVDAHHWGWALGSEILQWEDPRLYDWSHHIVATMECMPIDRAIYHRDENEQISCSAHQRLMDMTTYNELLPVSDPTAWRMVVFYDN